MKFSNRRSRSAKEILRDNPRCIYCERAATTVEHMPPKIAFRGKDRPSGMEYPSCLECNSATSPADNVVAFFSRIDRLGSEPDWKLRESLKPLKSLVDNVPGFEAEFFGQSTRQRMMPTPGGVLVPAMEMHTGPIAQALLTVFTAKLGMATFCEFAGQPLPLNGAVHTMWFLNSGLSEETAHGILSILPAYSTLKQGVRKSATGQFDMRFNSDEHSIVAALTHFHGNIHFFTLAMAEPAKFGYPRNVMPPFSELVRPGELVDRMPKRLPAFVMQEPVRPTKDFLLMPRRT